jgi:Protein of unknown function (DUF1360)
MIRITDQYFWNVVFGLFFLLLAIMGAIILDTETRIPFDKLTLTDFVLISLASWRLIRLFVYDTMTKWLREQFYDVKQVGKKYTLVKPATGPRRTMADLFSCPWCFGLWASASVTFFYLITPYAYFFVLFLALAAVASFLQILTNMIGWHAEKLQDEVEG